MERIKFQKNWDKQYTHIHFDKLPVEKGFGWTKGQQLDIGAIWRISASQPPNPIMGWDKNGDQI